MDMDLVRYILKSAEAFEGSLSLSSIEDFGCDAYTAAFHVEVMKSNGLVEAHGMY